MQAIFSDLEYAAKKKVTGRDRFLGEMEAMTPWPALLAQIEPFTPKEKAGGVRRWDLNGCFACKLPSNVSAYPTKVPKTPFTTARQSGDLSVSTSRAKAHPMPRPCSSFVACWRNTH